MMFCFVLHENYKIKRTDEYLLELTYRTYNLKQQP